MAGMEELYARNRRRGNEERREVERRIVAIDENIAKIVAAHLIEAINRAESSEGTICVNGMTFIERLRLAANIVKGK